MCQVIIGQALTPDSERKVNEKIAQSCQRNIMKLTRYQVFFLAGLQELGCNVTGEWYSELGSQLQFSVVGPEVRGVYRTAVEIARGAAGPSHEAKVVGVISDGPQPTIAFSVLWAKGNVQDTVQCFTASDAPDPINQLINRVEVDVSEQKTPTVQDRVLRAQEPAVCENATDAEMLF